MKLVILASSSPDRMGGATRVAFEYASFASKIHDVTLIYPDEKTDVRKDDDITYVTIKSAKTTGARFPILSRKTVKYIFDYLDSHKPDVIHSQNQFGIGLIGQVWANMNRVPFIFTSHDLPSKNAVWLDLKEGSYMYSVVEKSTIKYYENYYDNCSAVIALNKVAADDMRSIGYDGDLHIIPNGRDLDMLTSVKYASPKKRKKKLLYIGSFGKRKNQGFLIKAMKYLPDNYELILVGEVLNPVYKKKMMDYAKKNGIRNVKHIGSVPYEKIPKLLEKSHLFVSASTAEVQSLAIIESLASGTPVVGLSNETIDELVNDKIGVALAKNASPEEFAGKVDALMSQSDSEYLKMCDDARKSMQEFHWDNIVNRVTKVYKKYLVEKPENSKNTKERVKEIIETLPEDDMKKDLRDVVNKWEVNGVDKKNKIKNVSRKTVGFVGLTLAIFSSIYVLLKVFGKVAGALGGKKKRSR